METIRIIIDTIFKLAVLFFVFVQTRINCDMMGKATTLFEVIYKQVEHTKRLENKIEKLEKQTEKKPTKKTK